MKHEMLFLAELPSTTRSGEKSGTGGITIVSCKRLASSEDDLLILVVYPVGIPHAHGVPKQQNDGLAQQLSDILLSLRYFDPSYLQYQTNLRNTSTPKLTTFNQVLYPSHSTRPTRVL